MKQLSLAVFIFFVILFLGCTHPKPFTYSDNIFNNLSLSPEEFQQKNGGLLEYYIPSENSRNKEEAEKQAFIKTQEYRIFWKWQFDKYIPELLEFTTNKFLLEGNKVIDRTKEEIINLLGKPDEVYPSSIVYLGVNTSIGFGFKNNIVIKCSMGLR